VVKGELGIADDAPSSAQCEQAREQSRGLAPSSTADQRTTRGSPRVYGQQRQRSWRQHHSGEAAPSVHRPLSLQQCVCWVNQ
jgi:hypothetical protein